MAYDDEDDDDQDVSLASSVGRGVRAPGAKPRRLPGVLTPGDRFKVGPVPATAPAAGPAAPPGRVSVLSPQAHAEHPFGSALVAAAAFGRNAGQFWGGQAEQQEATRRQDIASSRQIALELGDENALHPGDPLKQGISDAIARHRERVMNLLHAPAPEGYERDPVSGELILKMPAEGAEVPEGYQRNPYNPKQLLRKPGAFGRTAEDKKQAEFDRKFTEARETGDPTLLDPNDPEHDRRAKAISGYEARKENPPPKPRSKNEIMGDISKQRGSRDRAAVLIGKLRDKVEGQKRALVDEENPANKMAYEKEIREAEQQIMELENNRDEAASQHDAAMEELQRYLKDSPHTVEQYQEMTPAQRREHDLTYKHPTKHSPGWQELEAEGKRTEAIAAP